MGLGQDATMKFLICENPRCGLQLTARCPTCRQGDFRLVIVEPSHGDDEVSRAIMERLEKAAAKYTLAQFLQKLQDL